MHLQSRDRHAARESRKHEGAEARAWAERERREALPSVCGRLPGSPSGKRHVRFPPLSSKNTTIRMAT